jgi:hypothetical protein
MLVSYVLLCLSIIVVVDVPGHILYHSFLPGTVEFSKEFDPNLWMEAMLNESEAPQEFYPEEFKRMGRWCARRT